MKSSSPFFAAALLILASCSLFDPRDPQEPSQGGVVWETPTNPDLVVENMQSALAGKSVLYLDCLDDSFVFYADTNDSPVAYDERGYNVAMLARVKGWSVDLEWGTELYDYAAFDDDFDREGFRASLGWFVIPSKWEIRARYAEIQRLKNPSYRKAVDSGLGVPEVVDGDGGTPALEGKISEISVAASVLPVPGGPRKSAR